jgi:hypothetical protein
VTESTLLGSLILSARQGGEISPAQFASLMVYDLRELENWARVPSRSAETEPEAPQLQAYMRRSLRVIDALLGMKLDVEKAMFWFRCAMVGDFRNRTPQALLADDCEEAVIASLARVFVAQSDTLAPLWERMRQDTLSVQKDIFRDVRMLSAQEVAAICGTHIEAESSLELARALAWNKTMFFITENGEPCFPAFQFSVDGPKAIIASLLKILSPLRSNWEVTLWCCSSSGWLDGASPFECLDSLPELVLDAAFQEVAEELE